MIDLVYPKKCLKCGGRGKYFCDNCRRKSEQIKQICPSCGRPSIGGWLHGRCQGEIERLIVGMRYRGLVSLGLRRVKFGSSWAILDELFEWWWERVGLKLKEMRKDEWLISWIPMHKLKKRKRGFDQAEILAQKLAQKLDLEAVELLERIRQTKPQFGLGEKERQINLKNAFKLKSGGKNSLLAKKVLLVDDIWTTGSTMKNGAKVLEQAGIKKIWGVVVCS